MLEEKKITQSELSFLLQPSVNFPPDLKIESPFKWLHEDIWKLVLKLREVSSIFKDLPDHVKAHEKEWLDYYESQHPEDISPPYLQNPELPTFSLDTMDDDVFRHVPSSYGSNSTPTSSLNSGFSSQTQLNTEFKTASTDGLAALFSNSPSNISNDNISNAGSISNRASISNAGSISSIGNISSQNSDLQKTSDSNFRKPSRFNVINGSNSKDLSNNQNRQPQGLAKVPSSLRIGNYRTRSNSMQSKSPVTSIIETPTLNSFQKLMILRVFHLEKMREGLRQFIAENMGTEFVTPPTLNLMNIFKESDPLSPLIFIIMPGIDPEEEILTVARTMEMDRYLKTYSLGRGRGEGAEELINDAAAKGFWVLLQNCHLSLSWMPRLEYIINHLDAQTTHKRFRLCLVTMSSDDFPIGILYQGTKLIYEIPKGMKENVLRLYSSFNIDDYLAIENASEKQLTFHLAFFHGVVLERLQFGSIGWNIPYEFNPSDFTISRKHLQQFLAESGRNAAIPIESLSYVIGELNYGGRVTDKWDRRLLLSLLNNYFSEELDNQSIKSRYPSPSFEGDLNQVLHTVSSWPDITLGGDVGLSDNATTITARNEALKIFSSIIEVVPTLVAASDSLSEEEFAQNFVETLISKIPKQFNLNNFAKRFHSRDTVSIVLEHEILLYNHLIETINKSLESLQKGLKGELLLDDKLEAVKTRLLSGKVPEWWLEQSYPSILNLNNYIEDLNMRINFLNKWISEEKPIIYNLGAFYHPEEFLTAVLQVYARKHIVPFDSLLWKTEIETLDFEPTEEPEEGIYIKGLPIEGAKWDEKSKTLVECAERELDNNLPIIHLIPTQEKKLYNEGDYYECPVYRTQSRGTGALDLPNYILSIYIPSNDSDHWIQRSVAAFITTQ